MNGKCPYLITLPITVPIQMVVDGVQQIIVSGKACVGGGKCSKKRGAYVISWRCSRIGDGDKVDSLYEIDKALKKIVNVDLSGGKDE